MQEITQLTGDCFLKNLRKKGEVRCRSIVGLFCLAVVRVMSPFLPRKAASLLALGVRMSGAFC